MSERPTAPSPAPTEALIECLLGAPRLLLVGHERPDGDCLGAQSALARLLGQRGAEVTILNPDAVEAHLAFLSAGLEFCVYEGQELPPHDVCVLLDGNELARCGALAVPVAKHSSTKIVIDHHLHRGPVWWDLAYLDSNASATGILVWRIAQLLEADVDRATAEAIYTSIVTDTGWFRHPNTDPESLRAAARLLELGVDAEGLRRTITGGRPSDYPSALASLLDTTEYLAAGRLAVLADTELGAHDDGSPGDAALEILRRVRGVEVILYFRLVDTQRVKVSSRSTRDFDVRALMARFGGGGHRLAAGATIQGSPEESRARVVAAAVQELATSHAMPVESEVSR